MIERVQIPHVTSRQTTHVNATKIRRFHGKRVLVCVFLLFLITIGTCTTLLLNAQRSHMLFMTGMVAVAQTTDSPIQKKLLIKTAATTVSSRTRNVSQAMVRISRLDVTQYNSIDQMKEWSPSACSAIAMTEILNAYGNHYKVKDVLGAEAAFRNPTVITAESGLLYPQGIERTMKAFGFATQQFPGNLEQLIQQANKGTPVMVNFPPSRFAGGHFLNVVGGDAHSVFLVDSSDLNMRVMSRGTFLGYWAGLAFTFAPGATVTSLSNYTVLGKPTLTVDFINKVFAAYASPAQGKGQALYDLGVKYGIDPAFALAFFGHESTFGKSGEANSTLSLGNLRCIPDAACVNQSGQQCQSGQSCYAAFPTWEAGFEAWYKLISNLYVAVWGLTTVDQIIPRYAPPSDNNNDVAYITALKRSIDRTHAGLVDIENFS